MHMTEFTLRSSRNKDWGVLGESVTYLDICNRSRSQCHWICYLFFCALSSANQTLRHSGWRSQTRWSLLSATRSTQLEDWRGHWCFFDGRRGSWSSVRSPWFVFCCSLLFKMFVQEVEGLVRRGCNPRSGVLPNNNCSVLSRLYTIEDELEWTCQMNTHPLSLPPSRIPYTLVREKYRKKQFFSLSLLWPS